MRCATLAFLAGVCLLQSCAALPPCSTVAAAGSIALLLLALRRRIATLTAAALLGAAWAACCAHLALGDALPRELEGKDIVVIGSIASLPHEFDGGTRFNFDIEQVETPGASAPRRVALSWYGPASGAGSSTAVAPGERWRLVVRLQRPHGNANPFGFDYEAWLLEQGVRATGYVRPAGAGARHTRLDAFVPRPGHVVERIRAALRRHILAQLEGKRYAGVIVALVIGDQRGIDQSDWDVFNRTGISHLVSISGLHVTMLAGLAAWAVSRLWRRSFFIEGAALPLYLPAQKAAALAGAVVALLYVLLAGFGVPAQRTFYMLAVVAAALWTGRVVALSHILCLALAVVVVIDPWAVLSAGFWLSFGAVAVILYANLGRVPGAAGWRRTLAVAARTQYAVTIGLVPLTMFLFSQVSLASPLANAIAIPVVSLLVTPLALLGAMLPAPLSGWVLGLAHLAVELLADALARVAASPLAVLHAPAPQPWVLALALLGTAWMLAPRGWPQRWAGLAAWAPMLTQLPGAPPAGSFSVTAFDVGQGMALLVETHGHRLLYDAGPQYAPGANAAGRVLLPYLRGRGIGTLDAMVVSHSDVDHAGGAQTVLEGLEVASVHSSLATGHPVVRAARQHTRCAAGQGWRWDAVDFEVLGPAPASYDDAALKANARSCVLRVSAAGGAILLAADIEAAQEAQLLLGGAERLRADVLLAPHHGSGTSSTAAFLAAVKPSVGIFQVGRRNRYRHPKAEVYARYGSMNIRRIRTDESGAVTLEFGQGLLVSEYRSEHRRYWHGR